MKDIELRLDILTKENLELKKINENLKSKTSPEISWRNCIFDISKILTEKTLKSEKKISLFKEAFDFNLEKEITEYYNTIQKINNSNKKLFDVLIEKFEKIISEIFPSSKVK